MGGVDDCQVLRVLWSYLPLLCLQVDTKNILFLCGGAFVGLENQVAQRLTSSSIGFGNPIRYDTSRWLK